MHDGKDAGFFPIGLLDLAVVWYQALHLIGVLHKSLRRAGRQHSIDLARQQHRRQRGVGHGRVAQARRQLQANFFFAPGVVHARLVPSDFFQVHAVFVGQQTPRINGRGLCPFGQADLFSFQVFRALDATVAAHINRRVAKCARGKHRNQGQPRVGLGHDGDGLGKRHLAHIPLFELGEAKKHFFHRWVHGGDVNARCAHKPAHQIAQVVVIAQGDRELNVH